MVKAAALSDDDHDDGDSLDLQDAAGDNVNYETCKIIREVNFLACVQPHPAECVLPASAMLLLMPCLRLLSLALTTMKMTAWTMKMLDVII